MNRRSLIKGRWLATEQFFSGANWYPLLYEHVVDNWLNLVLQQALVEVRVLEINKEFVKTPRTTTASYYTNVAIKQFIEMADINFRQ
jgi:hypothetical protein